ncbi:hypothetical protein SO802_016134 [Lithocarpus litseifolius]|uniref:Zinc finger GRF-type domain-containing protein n=1 Tax=Lithocarpus litseifolius TaxID=425828 RepID=A0AAW2CXU5_9ROSI
MTFVMELQYDRHQNEEFLLNYIRDHCALKTSLKLHTFGRRFDGCRYWSPDDDRACKFFKWLDTSPCTCGAATTLIVFAKFRQLEHEVEVANEELKQARAMGEAALEREQAAK